MIRSGAIGAAVLIAVASLVAQTRDSTSTDRLAIQALAEKATSANIVVTSSSAAANGPLPLVHSNYGEKISPPLRWTGVPATAASLAVVMEDPDAQEPRPFVHWMLYNVPATATSLPEALPGLPRLPELGDALQGRNSRTIGYFGPRPPRSDPAHHYHFQIFALTEMLSLQPSASRRRSWLPSRDASSQPAIWSHLPSASECAMSGLHALPDREPSVRIGCSGWQSKHWRGNFYPAGLSATRWLEYYATHFDTVEINNSFYRLPEADTFAEWRRRVPPSFIYAVKASRYLTHMKKLKEPGPPVSLFFSRARKLGHRLGPVLYQLPPRWPRNLERLETFLRALPKNSLHAIEFRDPTWYPAKRSICCADITRHSAFTTWLGPLPAGVWSGPSSICGCMVRNVMRDDILTRPSRRGPNGVSTVSARGCRSTPTSTTTPAVMHREMR